jgi:hypothetical protein
LVLAGGHAVGIGGHVRVGLDQRLDEEMGLAKCLLRGVRPLRLPAEGAAVEPGAGQVELTVRPGVGAGLLLPDCQGLPERRFRLVEALLRVPEPVGQLVIALGQLPQRPRVVRRSAGQLLVDGRQPPLHRLGLLGPPRGEMQTTPLVEDAEEIRADKRAGVGVVAPQGLEGRHGLAAGLLGFRIPAQLAVQTDKVGVTTAEVVADVGVVGLLEEPFPQGEGLLDILLGGGVLAGPGMEAAEREAAAGQLVEVVPVRLVGLGEPLPEGPGVAQVRHGLILAVAVGEELAQVAVRRGQVVGGPGGLRVRRQVL